MMRLGLIMLCTSLLMLACEMVKEHTLNASTIKISSVSLRNSTNQSISHNIRDLWVYIDDRYYGSFSVPFSIPILETGERRIKLYPGIRYYGILSKPEIYTLIEPVEIVQNLVAGNTLGLEPKFYYKNNTIIYIDEGFESGSVFVNDLDSLPGSKFIRTSVLFRDGNHAGYGALDKQNTIVETASTFFAITDKKTVFLEFDFKSDIDINVGILSFPSKAKNYYLTLRSASEWKKIYIPLHEVLFENNEKSFQLAFRGTLANSLVSAYYAIDNVRVLSAP